MRKRIISIFIIGYVVLFFAACGNYEPLATKGDVLSGQALDSDVITGSSVNREKVQEPTIGEIEKAYHNAIQHEYYLYGGLGEEFSGDKMQLYGRKDDNGYTYFLVDKISDEDGIFYSIDQLCYYTDCEEPGFETETSSFWDYLSEDKLKEKIKGAEQIGVLDSWKCQSGKKPDYPPMSRVTKKMIHNIEEKVKEEAKKYCVFSEEKTCHVYIPQFVPADRYVFPLLVIDEEKGREKAGVNEIDCDLHPQISIPVNKDLWWSRNPYDIWVFRTGKRSNGVYAGEYALGKREEELIERAVADFTFTLEPCQSLSELGLPDEIQSQIILISREMNTWLPDADTLSNPNMHFSFMIADLDQDGRLEVVEETQGKRYYEETIYEVSEDGKKLVKCKGSGSDEEDEVSIDGDGDTQEAYYDSATGRYYYRTQTNHGTPYVEDDQDYRHEYEGDFCLNGNVIEKRKFKEYKIYSYDIDDWDELKGYGTEDGKVSEDQYEAAVRKHWKGMEKKKVSFGWSDMGYHLRSMTEKEVQVRLARLWQEFSIE